QRRSLGDPRLDEVGGGPAEVLVVLADEDRRLEHPGSARLRGPGERRRFGVLELDGSWTDERAAEPVAVAAVAHLAELDQTAAVVLRDLVASEEWCAGLNAEELRLPRAGRHRLDREVRARRADAVALLQHGVERVL